MFRYAAVPRNWCANQRLPESQQRAAPPGSLRSKHSVLTDAALRMLWCNPHMPLDRDKLHVESVTAFDAAFKAFEQNPKRGTPEWSHWRRLCHTAVTANSRYLRGLKSALRPLKRDAVK